MVRIVAVKRILDLNDPLAKKILSTPKIRTRGGWGGRQKTEFVQADESKLDSDLDIDVSALDKKRDKKAIEKEQTQFRPCQTYYLTIWDEKDINSAVWETIEDKLSGHKQALVEFWRKFEKE